MADAGVKKQGMSTDLVAAVGAVLIVGMMVIPLPGWALDVLLSLNITMALTILLMTMYRAAAGFLQLPVAFADRHPVPSGAEHRGHQAHPAARGGGRGDPRLRLRGGWRELRGRAGGVHHPGDHPVRGDHQRRRPRGGGGRALHAGCHARQTDGHRCGPERRAHRRSSGARPARRWPRRRTSTARWMAPASSSAATPSPPS